MRKVDYTKENFGLLAQFEIRILILLLLIVLEEFEEAQ